MKKILTLALVLALALSLAAPALAFWGTAPTTSVAGGVTLDIYLVDHDDSGSLLSGLISMPATNRGYAKNEIVAAVATIIVPSGVELGASDLDYAEFRLSGSNVSVNVTDNFVGGAVTLVNTIPLGVVNPVVDVTNNRLTVNVAAVVASGNLRVLYFAKVTGDDAVMTVTLTRNLLWSSLVADATLDLGNTDYLVTRTNAVNTNPNTYTISDGTTDLFRIRTTAAGRADSIEVAGTTAGDWFGVVYSGGYLYAMTEDAGGLAINLGRLPTTAEQLVLDSRMNSIFANELGLDITKRGYSMTDANWETYANSLSNLTESVDVEPWTPYVTVPENIVVDPPKTGDAASILGFVMIALAGAAVVAVKKVRA